jgi:hypothetical protein
VIVPDALAARVSLPFNKLVFGAIPLYVPLTVKSALVTDCTVKAMGTGKVALRSSITWILLRATAEKFLTSNS